MPAPECAECERYVRDYPRRGTRDEQFAARAVHETHRATHRGAPCTAHDPPHYTEGSCREGD